MTMQSVLPGLSATKSTATVSSGITLTTSFRSPLIVLSPICVDLKRVPVQMHRMLIAAAVAKHQTIALAGMDLASGSIVGQDLLLIVQVSNFEPFMGPISRKVSVNVSSGAGAVGVARIGYSPTRPMQGLAIPVAALARIFDHDAKAHRPRLLQRGAKYPDARSIHFDERVDAFGNGERKHFDCVGLGTGFPSIARS